MKRFLYFFLAVVSIGIIGPENADADPVMFTTNATATQTLNSPLFGKLNLSADGLQDVTVDTMTGFADIESLFMGNDLPDPLSPGGFLEYDLYNTVTTGTVTENASGLFDFEYQVLFELQVTSGPLAGLTFETLDLAVFTATDLEIPWQPGATYLSPEPVDVFIKFDPTGTFPVGTLVGTSTDRVIVNNFVVPEPSASIFGLIGLVSFFGRRRR